MEKTDYELVKDCLNGDTDKFSELVARYRKLVYCVAYKFSRDSEEVNDLSQEVFVKIYKSLGRYDPQYRFSTWTVKVATNICLDFVRKKKLNSVPLEEIENYARVDCTPETAYIRKEKSALVRRAIDELPEIYRLPIIMFHQKGMSYKEIAETLGKPLSIIKNRIFRARHVLKENLLGVA